MAMKLRIIVMAIILIAKKCDCQRHARGGKPVVKVYTRPIVPSFCSEAAAVFGKT